MAIDRRQRLYAMMDAYGKARGKQVKDYEREMDKQKYEQDTKWGNSAATGAGIGGMFGPWGALAGGIIGSGVGTVKAFQAARAKGKGFNESLWEGINPINGIPDMDLAAGAGQSIGKGIQEKQWNDYRKQQLQQQQQQQRLPAEQHYSSGASTMMPSAGYSDSSSFVGPTQEKSPWAADAGYSSGSQWVGPTSYSTAPIPERASRVGNDWLLQPASRRRG
jgi:hypothetical protein